MNILLIGSSKFIGSHLLDILAKKNDIDKILCTYLSNNQSSYYKKEKITFNKCDVKKFSDMMLRNITRILKLMESMLKYGAHPSEKKESFSVNKVLEDIIELIQPKCKEDFIHLDTELKEKVSSFGCPINIYQAI